MAFTVFAYWVVFRDGAEVLEGSIVSAFVLDIFAPLLTAAHIRAYTVFLWIGNLAVLVITKLSH